MTNTYFQSTSNEQSQANGNEHPVVVVMNTIVNTLIPIHQFARWTPLGENSYSYTQTTKLLSA